MVALGAAEARKDMPPRTLPVDLSAYRDNAGTALPGVDIGPGLDGFGRSYPAEELGTVAGLLRTAPEAWGSGAPDNVACDGQRIELPAHLHVTGVIVLGSCTNGSFLDSLHLDDGDGGRQRVPVGLTDFLSARPVYGDRCHFTGSLLREHGRDIPGPRPRLYRHESRLDDALPCGALLLPVNPDMHIFGLWVRTTSIQQGVTAP
ncbi:hypothetical protein [Nonomuraea lactucae]|uniref:hypothetical protein n=1 Tax=Nonomuraea lactucae TaxID=2249762 RepID=UPI0019628D76|nr:hypothetical protein [Nonomuraea lactucae]